MASDNWLVNDDGSYEASKISGDWEWTDKIYRLYRFLTDVEDILEEFTDERQRLQRIYPLVRRLLTSSYWLQFEYLEPNPDTGWSVNLLYEEPNFPLTVQTVVWLPGQVSPIHNHATWGIVALISGREKNRLWRRTHNSEDPERIEPTGEIILEPGDIISLTANAIHSVEAMGDEPTISFNIYGETDYPQRFEFDPLTHTAKNF